MPIVSDKSKLSEIRKIPQGSSLETLGESRNVVTNPVKSFPTTPQRHIPIDRSMPGGVVDKTGELRPTVTNPAKPSPPINTRVASTPDKEQQVKEYSFFTRRQSQLINIFNQNPQEKGPVIPNLQTVNFFQNINAKGFTKFKQPKETDFITNKLIDNDTTFKQSQPQQFLDIRGNKTIEFTQTNRAPINNENSRLLSLHQNDNFLDNYYGQLKGSGQLGIRRQSGPVSLSLLKQPFIVRNIGNNWGIDTFDPSQVNGLNLGAVGQLLKAGLNVLDQLGGAVLGRQPSVFATRALADLGRQGSFLLSVKGIGFLEKQRILKRLNPQKVRTDVKYGVTADIEKLSTDVRGYDMHPINFGSRSLLSQPGIPSLQFDINRRSATQLSEILNLDEITKQYESDFRPPDIRNAFKELKQYNIEVDSKLNFTTDGLLDKLTPVGDFVSGVAQQAQDLATRGLNFLKGINGPKLNLGFSNPFKTPKLPNIKNPFSLGGGDGINLSIPGSLKGVGNFLSSTANAFGSISLNHLPLDSAKALASEIDLEAFAEVGQDKVNLIPYGTRNVNPNLKVADGRNTGDAVTKDGKTENELDFIPFRFEDSTGNLIVFRAILSGITDTFTPEYSSERYVGRPDNVYVYQGTTREISFTVDIYPKSAEELPILWKKMNYLAGLTYPEWAAANGGGIGMVAPFCKLTIGQMYTNTSGYISGLTFTVMDSSTWETMFAKLPKYIQAKVSFVYVGDRMPSKDQKHFELPWVPAEGYNVNGNDIQKRVSQYSAGQNVNKATGLARTFSQVQDSSKLNNSQINKALGRG